MLHYLNNLIAFLPLDIDLISYKDYFDFICKTLCISNNEKKKRRGQVVIFFESKLNFLLIDARLLVDKLDKTKLWVTRILSYDVIE